MVMSEELNLLTLETRMMAAAADLSEPDRYASNLCRELGCTYSYTVRIIQKWEEYGLVSREQVGASKRIVIPEEHRQVFEAAKQFVNQVKSARVELEAEQ